MFRKFTEIFDVSGESQVYEYFSQYGTDTYCNIINSILRKFFKPYKIRKDTYIIDVTLVE